MDGGGGNGAIGGKTIAHTVRKAEDVKNWEQYLKEGVSADRSEEEAKRMSDTEWAQRMRKEKLAPLERCRSKGKR